MEPTDDVNGTRAAALTGRSERTIRRMLKTTAFPGAHKVGNEWRIPLADLAPYRQSKRERAAARNDLAGQLATLRAEVEALKARLDALETATTTVKPGSTSYRGYAGAGVAVDAVEPPSISPTSARPPERHYNATFSPHGRSMRQEDGVWTHADAARWLVRHGIASETTPKSWPGWRETPPTPADVLALALSFADAGNWRKSWRLHPCDDSACVCQTMLPSGNRA